MKTKITLFTKSKHEEDEREFEFEVDSCLSDIGINENTDKVRSGLVVVFQVRCYFGKISFEEKFNADLKAYMEKYPYATIEGFIKYELSQLNSYIKKIEEYFPEDNYYYKFEEYKKLQEYSSVLKKKLLHLDRVHKDKKILTYEWNGLGVRIDKELSDLYSMMIDKYKLIAPETTYEQFKEVFTGHPIDEIIPIKWHDNNATELLYFIFRLGFGNWISLKSIKRIKKEDFAKIEDIFEYIKYIRFDYNQLKACFIKSNGEKFNPAWKTLKQNMLFLNEEKKKNINKLLEELL